ncbi:Non-specific lipid-transfer protein [Hibiscus syriacus]|uniref:Non-specific lipid-transfer protein n=1 Tax=Hibiscus syriacus TaxID=106335 RepID=A0A6A2XWM2_HIBSY|nr:Non-specific lipid-transfer protein [Hibiscus syriacus]
MASSLMSLKLACVVVLCLAVVGAPLAQGAINCGEVTSKLAPCIPYLKGPGGGAVLQHAAVGSKPSTAKPKRHQTAKQLATASKVRLPPSLAST